MCVWFLLVFTNAHVPKSSIQSTQLSALNAKLQCRQGSTALHANLGRTWSKLQINSTAGPFSESFGCKWKVPTFLARRVFHQHSGS